MLDVMPVEWICHEMLLVEAFYKVHHQSFDGGEGWTLYGANIHYRAVMAYPDLCEACRFVSTREIVDGTWKSNPTSKLQFYIASKFTQST